MSRWVQSDGGLVEDVENAREAGADLRRQPYALALATRQGPGVARQGQVFEPHIDEEAEAFVDLPEDALADLLMLWAQGLG